MALLKRKRINPDDEKKEGEGRFTIGNITQQPIVTEIKSSYLEYAMSVIVSRALPDVRDGLKPVHRRILFAMWSMGLRANAKFRKSATVVGEVLGKYHPHGDTAVYDSMVRMAQDFNLRYPLVQGQGNFGCFTKDTKVKLTDGRDLSFEDLVKEDALGKENYTYTTTSLGTIAIAKIHHPRITRTNAELVKISLDNGAEIRCTPNHLFMLKDGTYKEAQCLQPTESLMPLYTKLSTNVDRLNRAGYVLIYQNKMNEWVPAHHMADNYNLTNHVYTKSAGRVRHHVDFNKINNNPENIARLDWGEHWKIHHEIATKLHEDPEYRKKIAKGRNKFWDNPANRLAYAERMSQKNILNWKNPEYRKEKSEFLSMTNKKFLAEHPERLVIMARTASATLKKLWALPKYKKLFHEKIVASNKRRITNSTGKLKFLRICNAVLTEFKTLRKDFYEKKRQELYPYGMATTWDTGIHKYFSGDPNLVLYELNKNHKVVSVERLFEHEDVYDLTIDETHNFALSAGIFVHNSQDGDSAAAMRYTEAKLSKLAEEMLADLERDTVNFGPNYDNTQKEPLVLPALLPNLLLNGTMGIAVGMATNIPPHNLNEVCDAIAHLIDNPKAEVEDLAEFIKGPDFPTGAIIYSKKDILTAYATGRGGIVMRANAEIEETKDGQFRIVVTDVPYQVNKADLVTSIADLVRDKKLEGIRDLRDESSDREGVRVVVELKKDAFPKKVLNQLFQHTNLQTTFHVNMLSLVDTVHPRVLNLKLMLEEYVKHRQEVVKRRAEFDLKRAKERAHILEGLVIAQTHIDEVIKIIKASKDRDAARVNLMKRFNLSELQTNAILDMRLSQLAALERQKLEDELKEKKKLIAELEALLASPKKMLAVVKTEVLTLKEKYGDERRTKIMPNGIKEFSMEDLVPDEETLIVITRDGYIKRIPPDTFRTQGRGGKGVIGLTTKEEDIVDSLFTTSTHSDIMFFTTRGRVFQLKAYDIPQGSRTAKGQAVVNFLQLGPAEKVSATLPMSDLEDVKYLVMVTRKSVIKKVDIKDLAAVRRSGLIAIKLKGDDTLDWVKPSTGKDHLFIVTKKGMSIRFPERGVRAMGRGAGGVKAMRMKGDDEIIGMDVLDTASENSIQLLTVTEDGYGKRTQVSEYREQGRGGSGILTARVTEKTGNVIAAYLVNTKDDRDIIIMSVKGQVIRSPLSTISSLSRATQGVCVMKFKQEDDKVASITLV